MTNYLGHFEASKMANLQEFFAHACQALSHVICERSGNASVFSLGGSSFDSTVSNETVLSNELPDLLLKGQEVHLIAPYQMRRCYQINFLTFGRLKGQEVHLIALFQMKQCYQMNF